MDKFSTRHFQKGNFVVFTIHIFLFQWNRLVVKIRWLLCYFVMDMSWLDISFYQETSSWHLPFWGTLELCNILTFSSEKCLAMVSKSLLLGVIWLTSIWTNLFSLQSFENSPFQETSRYVELWGLTLGLCLTFPHSLAAQDSQQQKRRARKATLVGWPLVILLYQSLHAL